MQNFGMLGIVPTMTEEQMARKIALDKKNMEQVGYGVALPQNMLFGTLAGEGTDPALKGKSYSFEDVRKANPALDRIAKGLTLPQSNETYFKPQVGGLDFAAEMTLDPINALGALLYKMPLAGVKFLTKNQRAGQNIGSAPNVINDFYSVSEDVLFPPHYYPSKVKEALENGDEVPVQAKKAYEQWASGQMFRDKLESVYGKLPESSKEFVGTLFNKLPAKVKNGLKVMYESKDPAVRKDANKFLSDYFKSKGFIQWGGSSIGNALSEVFNPVSTAQYIKTGLTKTNQKRIQSLFNHEPQYHHATGELLPKTNRVMEREAIAQLQHAVYMAHRAGREDLPELLQETLDQMSVGGFRKFDSSDYRNATNQVNITKNGENYEVPEDISNALFARASKNWGMDEGDEVTMVVRQSSGESGNFMHDINFKAKGVTLGRKIFNENPKGFSSPQELKEAYISRGVPSKDIEITKDGVLVTTRTTSNSYLEGGINIVDHISLDGVSHSVVSDMYDFLENVPVAKKIEENLENSLWGVTHPVPQDLKKSGTFKTNRVTKEDVEKLKRLTNEASPDAAQVAVEATKIGAKASSPFVVGSGMMSDEDEK